MKDFSCPYNLTLKKAPMLSLNCVIILGCCRRNVIDKDTDNHEVSLIAKLIESGFDRTLNKLPKDGSVVYFAVPNTTGLTGFIKRLQYETVESEIGYDAGLICWLLYAYWNIKVTEKVGSVNMASFDITVLTCRNENKATNGLVRCNGCVQLFRVEVDEFSLQVTTKKETSFV